MLGLPLPIVEARFFPCVLRAGSRAALVRGDRNGALAVEDFALSPSLVARQDGQLVVTELRGTGLLTARPNPASAKCGTSTDIRPVTYDLVATPAG